MPTTDTDLDLRLRTFKASSSFTPGDACSFSIKFGEDATLPGKYDPDLYMQNLAADVVGKNVLVVCPGNAGLAVAALRAGASTVVALEPRSVYHRAIPAISEFASEILGTTFSQRVSDEKLVEAFDVVFWTEGLDEIPHPKTLVEKVVKSLAQGAVLYVEVNHGHSEALPDSINSWRPTPEAFVQTIAGLGQLSVVGELEGRSQTRKIYTIKNNAARVDETVQELDQQAQEAVVRAASTPSTVEKAEALDEALQATTEKADVLQSAGILPDASEKVKGIAAKVTSLMTGQEEGELDSVYEGRASTPKSKKKKKTRARRSKKTKPKS